MASLKRQWVLRSKENGSLKPKINVYNNRKYFWCYKAKRLVKIMEKGCPVDSIALDFAIRHLMQKDK